MTTPSIKSKTVKILLVEDDPFWQEGIESLLSAHSDFRLVETVDNYQAALDAFERLNPDCVLLDWKIKGERDGLSVGNTLLEKGFLPEKIVVISGSPVSSIPQHAFWSVGKPQIASDLIPLLESVIKN
jgi:DNA-binding NarL/FixJ family response regulator